MYEEFVQKMNSAQSAAERKAAADEMCRMFGFSIAKTYKVLKEHGWESGRKKRKDAGTSTLDAETLNMVAAMAKQGFRKNGKAAAPVNVMRSVLQTRGVDITVGDSQLRALLRQRHMAAADSKVKTPHQSMRTEYPNQVHLADPSVSMMYYEPGKKQKFIGDDELYKNKNFFKGKDGAEKPKCWRYVLTDHYSSSICVRYYVSPGETAANMYDFLLYAWSLKASNVSMTQFHTRGFAFCETP